MNLLRRILFHCCKFLLKKKRFAGEVLFECNFDNEQDFHEKFNVQDKEHYGKNKVFFVKEMVELVKGVGLRIKCVRESGTATTWEMTADYNWKSGCIATWNKDETRNHITIPYGVWEIEAKFPETWAAAWLLKPDYFVPVIEKDHIIPEIDLAENNGNVDNVIHYGFSKDKYTTKGKKGKLHKPDGKFHLYTAELLPNGYNFYLDGYLINEFRSTDPEFVSEQPNYLILNNAVKLASFKEDYSEFIVKYVKVRRN